MSTYFRLITLAIILVLLAACGKTDLTAAPAPPTDIPRPTPTSQGAGSLARNLLTYDDMMKGFDAKVPVDEAALTFPADASSPEHIFEGRLVLQGEDTVGEMTILRGNPDVDPEESHLPEFDFAFVQSDDGYLIPAQRGLIIADHPYWNYIYCPAASGRRAATRVMTEPPSPLRWYGKDPTQPSTVR